MAQWSMNPTRNHEVVGSILGLTQWVKGSGIVMICGAGCRRSSDLVDLVLLWLWRRPAATAPIRPLAWEPPHAKGAALKRSKTKKKKCQPQTALNFKNSPGSSLVVQQVKDPVS